MENIREVIKSFRNEFQAAFEAVGNNLASGLGKDKDTNNYTIEVRLTNDKLKSSLPVTYHGFKVVVEVIGTITAL